MFKRGQVTIFIIIGIILIVSFGLITYMSKQNTQLTYTDDAQSIENQMDNYVSYCLQQVSENAVVHIGFFGGYYKPPVAPRSGIGPAIHVYHGVDLSPQLPIIETQLSEYIDDELTLCLDSFQSFQRMGYSVEADEAKTQANIYNDSIEVRVKMPLKISTSHSVVSLDSFEHDINPIGLGRMHHISGMIVNDLTEGPEAICVSCIYSRALREDLKVDYINIDDEGLFIITDNRSVIRPYQYRFLVRFDEVGI